MANKSYQFTEKERSYLMSKVMKELNAIDKRIDVLDRGARAGYIPKHVFEGSSPERKKRDELRRLMDKLISMPFIKESEETDAE
jgi:hypothetical protein